jgi:DNA-binding transcriptional LysR family regulator
VRLLDRPGGRRPVTPTEAGALLLRHASTITAALQAADADLTALAEGGAGRLAVGTFASSGARILPAVIRRFRRQWPSIEVRLVESSDDVELLGQVARGDVDLTFVLLPVEGPFTDVELLRDPHVLLVPAGSPLAGRPRGPALDDLAGLPLIAYHRGSYEVETFLRANGIEPNVVFRSDQNAIVQGLVGAGLGSALVPRLGVELDDPYTVALDLAGAVPPRVIGMAWHRDRYLSAAARAFIEVVREYCRELA